MPVQYRCNNEDCPLGSKQDPGHFTGGMTAEQRNMITGEPIENMVEGKDFGEGICPSCGEQGEVAGEHESHEGTDDANNDGMVTLVEGSSEVTDNG